MPNPDQVPTPPARPRNQAADRQRLLRHMRQGQQPAADPARAWRLEQVKATLTHELRQAQPLIAQATPLAQNTAFAQPLRDDFAQTRTRFLAATQRNQLVEATARLGEHKRAAVNLINTEKAAQQKAAQIAQQATLHGEMAAVFAAVKKRSFPDGQAAYIGRQELPAEKHFSQFTIYLRALDGLEQAKKDIDLSKPVPAKLAEDLRGRCESLVRAADAYLSHFATDLSRSQQGEKSSLSKKRYCEEGKLSALQFMIALEFDQVGDPKASPQGWDEAAQMRAATTRAKLNYHQAYQEAESLKDGGDAAGMSDALWLQGAEFGQDDAPTSSAEAQLALARRKRVAIFKPFEGEVAATGSNDLPGAGAAKEALASANAKLFAAQTGIDLGVPETNVVAVNRYAIKGGAQSGAALDEVVGSAQFNAGASTDIGKLPGAVRSKIDRRDWQKIAMLDIMQLNCDRHEGNLMVKNPDSAKPELVPIDHGGSLPSRKDFPNVKARIGGITTGPNGASIVNAMLTTPAAYEAFDPELLAKLELLQPAEIEAGMKRQLKAMDQVHKSLGASAKVGDDSLHLSKRAMMFMKRAAKHLSPAEIQIALAERGEALFDAVSDNDFNLVADQVIADFVPLKDAYKEILTGPIDQVMQMADWLKNSGWGTPGGEDFMMQNPALALKLYRAQKVNPNPPLRQAPPAGPKRPDDLLDAVVTDEFKALYRLEYPGSEEPSAAGNGWKVRKRYHEQLAAVPQGATIYQNLLTLTGALKDNGAQSALKSLACWAELNKPANAALLARLKPDGATVMASAYLSAFLTTEFTSAASAAVNAQARHDAAAIDDNDALKLSVEAVLVRIDALAADPLLAASQRGFAAKTTDVRAELQLQNWDAAQALVLELDGQTLDAALGALRAIGKAEYDATMKPVPDRSLLPPPVQDTMNNLDSACLSKRSLVAARFALKEMRGKLPVFQSHFLSKLPAFSWDAKLASAAKKAAVNAKLIADKDTGMSDALKVVAEAQKSFDEALGDNGKPEKRRPAGEKAVAAYARFIQFTNAKLRRLSDQFEWQNYCAGGVEAANKKIAEIRSLMATWR